MQIRSSIQQWAFCIKSSYWAPSLLNRLVHCMRVSSLKNVIILGYFWVERNPVHLGSPETTYSKAAYNDRLEILIPWNAAAVDCGSWRRDFLWQGRQIFSQACAVQMDYMLLLNPKTKPKLQQILVDTHRLLTESLLLIEPTNEAVKCWVTWRGRRRISGAEWKPWRGAIQCELENTDTDRQWKGSVSFKDAAHHTK